MVLVNENITRTITMSQKLLTDYVNNETPINVHLHTNDIVVRNSIILKEFTLELEETYLGGDWFQLSITEIFTDIQYIEDEDCILIIFKDKKLYLDLGC